MTQMLRRRGCESVEVFSQAELLEEEPGRGCCYGSQHFTACHFHEALCLLCSLIGVKWAGAEVDGNFT